MHLILFLFIMYGFQGWRVVVMRAVDEGSRNAGVNHALLHPSACSFQRQPLCVYSLSIRRDIHG